MKEFFKGMFSDPADVDYFPTESQPLVEDPMGTSSSGDGEGVNETGLISLEEQRNREPATTTATTDGNVGSAGDVDNSPGLTDGYQAWAQSFDAFHQAIFHTLLYFTVGVIAYSYLLDTRWPIVDSVYFSVVIFTTGERE